MSVRGDSMLKDREMLGSELRDKIELYSELTGQDGWNVPITKVADFMSGFEMGREKFKTRGHWIEHHNESLGMCMQDTIECSCCGKMICNRYNPYKNYCPCCGADMSEDE